MSRGWRFVLGSIAVHAAVIAAAAHAPRPRIVHDVVTVEIVAAPPRRAEPMPAPVASAEAAPAAPQQPATAARIAVPRAPAASRQAVRLPPPPETPPERPTGGDEGVAHGLGLGAGLGFDAPAAPPPPPPPPPPAPVTAGRQSSDREALDRLATLVELWRHNDTVSRCVAAKIPPTLLDYLARGDRAAALATGDDFAGIYTRARMCIAR